jgi:hypothetical protein
LVDDLHYKYDNVGNILSEADTAPGNSAATDVQPVRGDAHDSGRSSYDPRCRCEWRTEDRNGIYSVNLRQLGPIRLEAF